MFLEILLAILIGVLAGIITGLTPGVHINLVAAISLGLAPLLNKYTSLVLVTIFIISMSITHNFIDMLPAIFLGAPEDATALGVLPGHRYLLRGNGMMAIKLTVIGGIAGTAIVIAGFPLALKTIGFLERTTKPWLFWILAGFIIFTLWKDKKRMWATIVFVLAGLLGVIVLRLPLSEPLLPMLSGIFGIATLLYSIKDKQQMPEQQTLEYTDLQLSKTVSGSLLGSLGAFITALFPGISSAMAAALVSRGGKLGDHGFMVLLGALGSASFVLSLAAWVSIGKARNGAMAVAVQLSMVDVPMLIACILITTGIAALLTLRLGSYAAALLPQLPYTRLCLAVIAFVAMIVAIRTGWLGMLVLVTSSAVGLLPAALKTARAQAMGCLLLPLLTVLW